MSYALLLDRQEAEQRMRLLYQQGWKVRDLAATFHVHPMIVQRVVEAVTMPNSGGVPSQS